MTDGPDAQLQLIDAATVMAAPRVVEAVGGIDLAAVDPVASVTLDLGLPHLDREFEYAVPADFAETAVPGARVRVRFSGKEVGGFVIRRAATAEHVGSLTPLRRVVSSEVVLTPAVLDACRLVAARQGGVLSDVLRLAVPPRHARTEAAVPAAGEAEPAVVEAPERTAWGTYPSASALFDRVAAGQPLGAAWTARPCAADDWPVALAQLAGTVLAGGRGVLLVVPDHRDVTRLATALTDVIGKDAFVRLTADQGPGARYRAFLMALRGHVRCVIGTRAAAYAPVADLGLVGWWDDGDDLHAEPRAPYAHVRDVLRARAEVEGAALVTGGFTRSVAVEEWVEEGVLKPVAPVLTRDDLPRVEVSGSDFETERHGAAAHARLPALALEVARIALADGPVLVQVPRRGYLPSVQCATCRQPARCATCHGPLALDSAGGAPRCGWCDRRVDQFRCEHCGSARLRAAVVGARRTAEELGRAFPGVKVIQSGAGEMVEAVAATPAVVVATPGAEPVADGGYAAVVLLDAWALIDRSALDAGEQALRRWALAAALARPRGRGGRVVLAGARDGVPAVQALVRWGVDSFAERELHERRQLRLPPAVAAATITGPRVDVAQVLDRLPDWADCLGVVRVSGPQSPRTEGRAEDLSRAVIRAPLRRAHDLAGFVHATRSSRALHKEAADVSLRMDPDGRTL